MTLLTFEQLHAEVAAFHAAEAARNVPLAVARRCVFELSSLLADLSADERREIVRLLAEETAEFAPIVA